MLQKLHNLLQAPFPNSNSPDEQIRQAGGIGVLISLALFVFQPFGLSDSNSSLWLLLICLVFGLITTVVILLNGWLLPKVNPKDFSEKNWTVGKEILYVLWNFFTVGCANFLFIWILGNAMTINNFLWMQLSTLMVGGFPVALSTIWQHNRLLRRSLQEVAQMQDLHKDHHLRHLDDVEETSTERLLKLEGKNQDEVLVFPANKLRYLCADGNYVEVYHAPDHLQKPAVIRTTLSELESQLEGFPFIQRCHRKYLVQLEEVDHYSGNAQGLKLHLHGISEPIPVSRSYLQSVRAYLQS